MSQGFQLEGRIHLINDVQSFASGFTKREFVIETLDPQYPQQIKFECVRERTALVDGLSPGDQVNVHFDIRGNEYQGKYYVNLNCWRLDRPGGGAPPQGGAAPQQQPQQNYSQAAPAPATSSEPYPSEAPPGFEDSDEDIPF